MKNTDWDFLRTNKIVTPLVILTFFLIFGFIFRVRECFEWDGEVILFGSSFLDQAKAGDINLYRYHWQALTYELFSILTSWPGGHNLARATPILFGATGLALLAISMKRLSSDRLSGIAIIAIFLLIPELLFSLLYMNSSILGLPWMTGCLAILITTNKDRPPAWRLALAGICLATACLFRGGFLLAVPVTTWLVWRCFRAKRPLACFSLGFGGAMFLAFAFDVFNPLEIAKIVLQHQVTVGGEADAIFYWTYKNSLCAGFSTLHVIAWLGVLVISANWLWHHRRDYQAWPIIPAALLLFYPMNSLASPKYLLPALCFIPLLLAWGLSNLPTKHYEKVALIGVLCAVLSQLVPLAPSRAAPFLCLDWSGEQDIQTHDGPRSYAGYLYSYNRMKQNQFPEGQAAKLLLAKLEASENKYILLGRRIQAITIGPLFGFLPLLIAEKGGEIDIHREWIHCEWEGHNVLVVSRGSMTLPPVKEMAAEGEWKSIRMPADTFRRKTKTKLPADSFGRNWLSFVKKLDL